MRNFKDPAYTAWRKEVYKRDCHQCQWPGCNKKNKLNAHHIKRWVDFPGLRFNVNNGITLCKSHHDQIKNMESDYELFFLRIVANKNG